MVRYVTGVLRKLRVGRRSFVWLFGVIPDGALLNWRSMALSHHFNRLLDLQCQQEEIEPLKGSRHGFRYARRHRIGAQIVPALFSML